jgi:hypothetical protein
MHTLYTYVWLVYLGTARIATSAKTAELNFPLLIS